MAKFEDYLNEQMANDEFKSEYEKLEPEFAIIQAVVNARKSNNITQSELAQRTGIAQSDISKLETGNSNPTIGMLKRLAEGLGMTVRLEFVPKKAR